MHKTLDDRDGPKVTKRKRGRIGVCSMWARAQASGCQSDDLSMELVESPPYRT